MKKALITGITGQDGAYLAHLLLNKGYQVHGIKRRSSIINTSRIDHLYTDPHEHGNLILHYGDLTDSANVIAMIQKIQPDEIYNLGAMSHVKVSFEMAEYTTNVDAIGVVRILDAIRMLKVEDRVKFYQASTSEMFGNAPGPQNELTPFSPQSPYAAAKLFAHHMTQLYRKAYNMFACCGILFNHESPIRGETFVTRKITMGVAKISLGLQQKIYLGNLNAERDWGHAKDYVAAMWMMMQLKEPDDFVIATGASMSVREFLYYAFIAAGITVGFYGEGLDEYAYVEDPGPCSHLKTGDVVAVIDPVYFRPAEVDKLCGDWKKAERMLQWKPTTPLYSIIIEMVNHDINLLKPKL